MEVSRARHDAGPSPFSRASHTALHIVARFCVHWAATNLRTGAVMDQLFATARRVSLHGTTEVSRTVRRVIMRVAALAVLVAAYAPVSAQAATFQFAGAAAYPTDTAPESIATGDLNGDGKVDLVTAN